MEEALELLDGAVDVGIEGVIMRILRTMGLIVVLMGVALWLFVGMDFFIIPALLIGLGLVFLIAPQALFLVAVAMD